MQKSSNSLSIARLLILGIVKHDDHCVRRHICYDPSDPMAERAVATCKDTVLAGFCLAAYTLQSYGALPLQCLAAEHNLAYWQISVVQSHKEDYMTVLEPSLDFNSPQFPFFSFTHLLIAVLTCTV